MRLTGAAGGAVGLDAGLEDAGVVGAVVVPVADDRLVSCAAELEHFVLRVELVVAVRVDEPPTVAEHADFIETVAVVR